MAVYRYGSEASPQTLRLRRWLAALFIVSAAGLAASFWTPGRAGDLLGEFAFGGVIMFGIFLWALQTAIRHTRKGSLIYEVEITPAGVTRRLNGRELCLPREDITGYSLNRSGSALMLRTPQRARQFDVSASVESFAGLVAELQGMGIAEAPPQTWANDWRFRGRVFAPSALMLAGLALGIAATNPVWIAAGDLLFLATFAEALLWPACANGACSLQRGAWRWVIVWLMMDEVVTDLHEHAGWPMPPWARPVLMAGDAAGVALLLWEWWRERRRRARASRLVS